MAARSDFHVVSLFFTFGFFFSVDLFLFPLSFPLSEIHSCPTYPGQKTEEEEGGKETHAGGKGEQCFFSLLLSFFP